MLGYRRKSFNLVHALLREIVQSPQDISTVLACQRILLQEILRAEAHIFRHKDDLHATRITLKTSRPNKSEAQRLKRRIKWIEARIEAHRQLIYIWRCFGDGIAFSYLDKHAIKHAFYETETTAIKQDAGFMSGKDGLAKEIELVEDAARAGVPSILVDLTNSIRHGDICLLGGSDPYLIEVKTGDRLNERGKRQVVAIDKLHAFYETDLAVGLRGYPELRRVTAHASERCYVDEMNACIDRAEGDGHCVVNPEPGLYYAATYGAKGTVQAMFGAMTLEAPIVFSLNVFKSNRSWSPYLPLTLSIYKQHHLYDFIRGELFLVVVLNTAVLCRQLAAKGLKATFGDDTEYPLSFGEPETDARGGISSHFLTRVGLEFLSPNWILDSALTQFHAELPAERSPA